MGRTTATSTLGSSARSEGRQGRRQAGFARATIALTALGVFAQLPAAHGQSEPPSSAKWTPAASMPGPRENFTATVLRNGKVLVAGTPSGTPEGPPGDPTKSTLLYDPVKNTWGQTGAMITSRSIHSATLLADGRVLVVGGLGTTDFLNTAEIYDPATGKWRQAGAIGQGGRHWHTATLLNDGKVLVAGGRNQSHDVSYTDAWLYDPKANSWTQTGSFEVARRSHTANLLNDGTVLMTGGQASGHDLSLKDAVIYDPAAGAFKPAPDLMSVGRAQHTASLLADGRVLIAGGTEKLVGGGNDSIHASAEFYDSKTQTFKSAGALAFPRHAHTAVGIPGGLVLLAGGQGGGTPGKALNLALYTAESYDPTAGRSHPAGSLNPVKVNDSDPLAYQAAVLLDQKPCGANCEKVLALGADGAELFSASELNEASGNEAKRKGMGSTMLIGAALVLLVVLIVILYSRSHRKA